ncbi:MAG: hypothetical protein KDB14_25110 [Planctomycetales bacterium]|nr:hypothetical protein [Planctomycetales bacterium]
MGRHSRRLRWRIHTPAGDAKRLARAGSLSYGSVTMRFSALFAIVVSAAGLLAAPASAEAQSIGPRYVVEVEYWFFDTDYYYWSTKLDTTNYNDAVQLYEILQAADEAGVLNQVVPNSYWRYIAVDVRMRTVWPSLMIQPVTYSPLSFYRLRQ